MKLFDQHGLVDNVYRYIHTQIELTKIEVQERIEEAFRKIMMLMLVIVLASLFLVFLFLSLAFYLNEVFSSDFWGFVIVTILLGIPLGIFGLRVQKYWAEAEIKEENSTEHTNLP